VILGTNADAPLAEESVAAFMHALLFGLGLVSLFVSREYNHALRAGFELEIDSNRSHSKA
jgi:hypothetical protein